MANRKSWLPRNHAALYSQAVQTKEYLALNNNQTRIGLDQSSTLGQWYQNTFLPTYDAYNTAYLNWQNKATRTGILTEVLREAEKAFIVVYSHLYYGVLKGGPLVTDDDLVAMGLPTRHSGGNTPAPVETHYPGYRINTGTTRRLIMDFFDSVTNKKAKPAGQHGAELRWAILEAPPVHIDELIHSTFDTHSPLTLAFDENQRGQTVYFAFCWENTSGEKGPYSPVQSVVIP